MFALKKIFRFFLFPLFLIFSIVILSASFDIKRIDGDSMNPTLRKGDRIVVLSLYNGKRFLSSRTHAKILHNDIVIFKSPQTNQLLIKRVLATEGDLINFIDPNTISINGEVLHISDSKKYLFEDFTKIPKHAIFLLGDNRSHSTDSRDFGFVTIDRVQGKVLFKISARIEDASSEHG